MTSNPATSSRLSYEENLNRNEMSVLFAPIVDADNSNTSSGSTSDTPSINNRSAPHDEDGPFISSSESDDEYTELAGSDDDSSMPGAHYVYPSGIQSVDNGLDTVIIGGSTVDGNLSEHNSAVDAVTAEVVDEEALLQQRTKEAIQKRMVDPTNVVTVKSKTTSSRETQSQGQTAWQLLVVFYRQSACHRAFVVLFLTLTVVGVGLAIALVVVLLSSQDPASPRSNAQGNIPWSNTSNISTSSGPGTTTVTKREYLQDLLFAISGASLFNESSYQYETLQWLVNVDEIELPVLYNGLEFIWIERYALGVLYLAMGGPSWTTNGGFMSSAPHCDWSGISCDGGGLGRVKSIYQDGNNLTGNLPYELTALSHLEEISFIENNINGTFPQWLGDLSFLRTIDFRQNLLSGTLPRSLSQLRKLDTFRVHYNHLTGQIPQELFQIDALDLVDLGSNYLSGTIPELNQATHIRQLFMNEMVQLQGSIPESLYLLTDATILSFGSNYLTGTLSSRIGELSYLEYFDVYDNWLTGILPTEIGRLERLTKLNLAVNLLDGPLPSELGNLPKLEVLYLFQNKFSGPIPSEIGAISTLMWFSVGFNNDLTGPLPNSLATMPSLEWLDIAETSLTRGNGIDAFCNSSQNDLLTQIWADCGDDSTDDSSSWDMDCSCCTTCCNHGSGGYCVSKVPQVCRVHASHFENENGNSYDPLRNATCTCHNEGRELSCDDTSCLSCNRDGSVCAVNEDYGYMFNGDAVQIGWKVLFRYVVGRDDIISFQDYGTADMCDVSVNGHPCESCTIIYCPDGFTSYEVLCNNVEGVGSISLCNDDDSLQENGPLSIFQMVDTRFRSGCEPMFNRLRQLG